jgi:hypothetical protein
MKNLKKTLAMVASVAMAGSVFAACGGSNSSSSSNNATTTAATTKAAETEAAAPADTEAAAPADTEAAAPADTEAAAPAADGGSKLTVLCWNTDDINPMLKCFCENTGHTEDEFDAHSFGVAGGQAAETYDAYLSDPANDADIIFVEADWALKYINDDSAETGTKPLNDIGFSDGDYTDLRPYTVEIGKSSSGVQKGLSWQAAAGGFCYREDLAEKYLGVTNPDDFQAKVSNWDNFLATAKEVKEASGGKTALTATLGGIWQVFSAGRSTPWVVDNKLVLDDTAKDYISFAKTMYDEGYIIKDLAQWNPDWYAAGTTDDTMGYFVSTWGFGDAILTSAAGGEGGETYGKWKVCVGPQAFFWGGTWMTVATRCDNPELVKEFMSFFTTNTEGAQKYAEMQGEFVSNKKAMENVIAAGVYKGNPVLGGQNQFEVLNVTADQIDMTGAITPYDSPIKGCFNDAVNRYCQGVNADVDATIEDWYTNVAAALPTLDYSNFE